MSNYKTLNNHYCANKAIYDTLIRCTSVQELLLKINIYGKTWTHYDWSVLMFLIICQKINYLTDNDLLYDDILTTISESDIFDNVMTNRSVMTSLVILCGKHSSVSIMSQLKIKNMLAVILKKYPKLWNMSWMYTVQNYKLNGKTRKQKVHRFAYDSADCSEFIRKYLI